MKQIDKAYNHHNEGKLYEQWEKQGYFRPELNMSKDTNYDRKKDGKPFVVVIPPPNVTGKLHVGHALGDTIEDIACRYHRLCGQPTLWLPGMDHAGIATQAVVEKMLRKKGVKRHELGREKFVDEVWKWKEEYGGIIISQIRRLGASCDWSRERFTLDEGLNRSVNEAFKRLYDKGLIYRGEYIVNWCPKCQTAIADDEVEHIEQSAKLYFFRYDKDFPITIATTRPETKLGDTGVAVNPKDPRYIKYIGKTYTVDIDGVKREIKVFADRSIDMKFGTGAVGVTPAHSAADWRMAEENNLSIIKIIDEFGRMTDKTGKYQGLKTKQASEQLLAYLQKNNLLEKIEQIDNNLSVCYRCQSAIEPLPSKQWFVKMAPLAKRAKEAVKNGQIKIMPKRFEKVYFHWLDNIRDWCISRQLWWGHRIPVWYRKPETLTTSEKQHSQDNIYVGTTPPADIDNWQQDTDVLDTWFSSSLWPFSTFGWPDKTQDLSYFYPTTVLETAYDILFFWVARMIMMGLELTDQPPFETVYLHGIVRDEQHRKMSKSLGNVLEPVELIDKYGADALRMGLVVGSSPGQDLAVSDNKIKAYRNFSNKIWNASRFVMLRISAGDLQTGTMGAESITDLDIDSNHLSASDKDILSQHDTMIAEVTNKLDELKFSQAGEIIYEYFWHTFCDKYIESAKIQLEDDKTKENTKKILIKILSESLIVLHPFTPFVTEAVWQNLVAIYPKLPSSIMLASWPKK